MNILYEDKDILVIDKPAGMVVNRAESVKGETVQDWMESKYKFTNLDEELFVKRSGIAHRLDKETSGCLVATKNPQALIGMLKAFKTRTVKKHYIAMVHGILDPKNGTIRMPMSRSRRDRKMWQVHYDGKNAETTWKVEEYFNKNGEDFTLVSLYPKTGRTHQIRVHMTFLKHPLVGDEKYLSHKKSIEDRKIVSRHLLHAKGISFKHPITGEDIEVESNLPDDFEKFKTYTQ